MAQCVQCHRCFVESRILGPCNTFAIRLMNAVRYKLGGDCNVDGDDDGIWLDSIISINEAVLHG